MPLQLLLQVRCRLQVRSKLRLHRQILQRSFKVLHSSTAWLGVIFIFQLPATIFSSCHDKLVSLCLLFVVCCYARALCLPGIPGKRRRRWRCGSSCQRNQAGLQLLPESPPPMMSSSICFSQSFRYSDSTFCQNRVLEYTHRSVPNNSLSCLSSLCEQFCRFPVRYPGRCQQGYSQHQHSQPGSQHRSGSGKRQLQLASTGRISFLPSFSAP